MDTMRRAGSGNAFPRIMFGHGGCPAARPARAASYPSSEGTISDVEKDSSFRDIVTAARKPYPPCFHKSSPVGVCGESLCRGVKQRLIKSQTCLSSFASLPLAPPHVSTPAMGDQSEPPKHKGARLQSHKSEAEQQGLTLHAHCAGTLCDSTPQHHSCARTHTHCARALCRLLNGPADVYERARPAARPVLALSGRP